MGDMMCVVWVKVDMMCVVWVKGDVHVCLIGKGCGLVTLDWCMHM